MGKDQYNEKGEDFRLLKLYESSLILSTLNHTVIVHDIGDKTEIFNKFSFNPKILQNHKLE